MARERGAAMSMSLSFPRSSSEHERVPGFLGDDPVRELRDEILFQPGERKRHLYLIEVGSIALYQKRIGRPQDVVEFAFTGDVVGFGFLENHIHWAQALGETRVRCLPLSALDHIVQDDERAARRYGEALRREFEFRRDELIGSYRKPANRLAAFFLALSQLNKNEGRDPYMITDSLECGTVAGCVALDLDALGRALVELEKAGLIKRCPPQGLRLTNLVGLGQLANEISSPMASPAAVEFGRAGSPPMQLSSAMSS
jgi:CRP/FNR family transcriptional regulator, anaerobic regulatory protein